MYPLSMNQVPFEQLWKIPGKTAKLDYAPPQDGSYSTSEKQGSVRLVEWRIQIRLSDHCQGFRELPKLCLTPTPPKLLPAPSRMLRSGRHEIFR